MLLNDIDPRDYLLSKIDSIILRKIILKYPVKNIVSFFAILQFIAELDTIVSTRELHRLINTSGINISLITLNEYLGYLLEEKILIKIPRYEIKTGKIISGKVQYYFSDTAIRDGLLNFTLNETSRVKNNILDKFSTPEYNIFTGKNRSFEFDFIIQSPSLTTYFIHVFQGDDKYELKKLIHKMIKIHQIPGENNLLEQYYKKYVVVESFEKLTIQKRRYGDLEIVETESFLERIAPK